MKKSKDGLPVLNRKQFNEDFLPKWKQTKKTKGILLMGPTSVGKTRIFQDLYHPATYGNYTLVSSNDLVVKYMKHGMDAFYENGMFDLGDCKVIDDIGTEISASNYGNKVDVIEMLILTLYQEKRPTHFTTNLNLEELTQRYGQRVVERLKEMCYIIVLEDTKFRELITADNFEDILNQEVEENRQHLEKERLEKENRTANSFSFPE